MCQLYSQAVLDNSSHIPILMAEDDEDDVLFATRAFKQAKLLNPLYIVENGQELIDYLLGHEVYKDRSKYPLPGLILLDLNMPIKNGFEALTEIKETESIKHIPIVVLTSSPADLDILKSYRGGVSGYIKKPISIDQLIGVLQSLGKYWFEIVELPKVV